MPDAKLAALIEQLHSDDPKARAKACQAMGKLGDPEAIPYLSKVYQRLEEDPKVVAAAENALRKFARKAPGASGGLLSARRLRTLVMVLAGSLVLLLLLNVVLRLGGDDDSDTEVTTNNNNASERDGLIETYQTLYQTTRGNFDLMRTEWGVSLGQLPCADEANESMQPIQISDKDRNTYPDIGPFADELNLIIPRLKLVIDKWSLLCSQPAGARGNLDDFTGANDTLNQLEGRLNTVNTLLTQAITNPAPTVGPTPTFTPLPPGVPSLTPIPTLTPTPDYTPTPAPTVEVSILSDILLQINNGKSGVELIKLRYWEPVQQQQPLPFGCNYSSPLPTPYPTDNPALATDGELAEVVRLLNEGITALSNSVNSFTTTCIGGGVSGAVEQGIADADLALSNFTQAETLLNTISLRGQ